MKRIICLIVFSISLISSFTVRSQNFEGDFNVVAEAFHEDLKPYLLRFIQAQYPESIKTPEMKIRDQALFEAYLHKAQLFNKDLKRALIKENPNANKKQIFEVFDVGYRMEFPGLDHQYFDNIRKRLVI
jgi:hypothetical protein